MATTERPEPPEGRLVHLVQRGNFDGLYLFEHEDDRDTYAALFPSCDTGQAYVMSREQAARRIAETCPGCGDIIGDGCDCGVN